MAPQAAGAEVPLDVQGCDESGSSPHRWKLSATGRGHSCFGLCQHGSNRLVLTVNAVMVQNIRLPILPRREACLLVLLAMSGKLSEPVQIVQTKW